MYQIPKNEIQRLAALESFQILDTQPEQAYDDIARLAACICNVEQAIVAFFDSDRKWHKARFNVDSYEMPRGQVIGSRTIMSAEPLIINDTLSDKKISKIAAVSGPPYIRFYAGIPIVTDNGLILGTLCALDSSPKSINPSQVESLEALGRQVMQLLTLRKKTIALENTKSCSNDGQDCYEKSLINQPHIDALTGLNNQYALNSILEKETHRSARYYIPLSILIISIDQFDQLDAQFGQSISNNLIVEVAHALQKRCRNSDFCARYSQEQFVILLPHTALKDAQKLAQQCSIDISTLMIKDINITISIGLSEFDPLMDPEDLLTAAGNALINAKNKGNNSISYT